MSSFRAGTGRAWKSFVPSLKERLSARNPTEVSRKRDLCWAVRRDREPGPLEHWPELVEEIVEGFAQQTCFGAIGDVRKPGQPIQVRPRIVVRFQDHLLLDVDRHPIAALAFGRISALPAAWRSTSAAGPCGGWAATPTDARSGSSMPSICRVA